MSDTPVAIPGNAGRNDYPRMIYHPDGGQRVVATAAEENDLLPQGWRQTPFPSHQKRASTPSIIAGINDPLATMIRQIFEQVLDERGLGKHPEPQHKTTQHSRR